MRFSVRWWDSEGLKAKTYTILDDALAFGESLWASGKARKVTVLDAHHNVVWEQPVR